MGSTKPPSIGSFNIILKNHFIPKETPNFDQKWPKILTSFHMGFLMMTFKEPMGWCFVEHFMACKSPILKIFESTPSGGLITIWSPKKVGMIYEKFNNNKK